MSIDETRAREEILWAIGMHCSHEGKPLPEPAEPCPTCSLIASEVLERIAARAAGLLGYVKADSEQWGYRRYPGYPINPCHLRDTAELALGSTPECTVERRAVGHGPWEVVSDADTQ